MNISAIATRVRSWWVAMRHKLQAQLHQAESTARQRPLWSLVGLLVLMLILIVVGDQLRTPEAETQTEAQVRTIDGYRIGESPTIAVLAEVEKTGVVTIVAQSAGVVRDISVKAGDSVTKGSRIAALSTSYSGGSVPSLQRQLTAQQYQNLLDTYDTQKQVIADQRKVAELQVDNGQELREIQEESLEDTEDLIELNEAILDTINDELAAATTSAELQASRQAKAQLLASLNQLRATQRSGEYQVDDDNPPAKLDEMQKALTLNQLAIEEKALDLQKEVTRLQLQIARVQESLLYPAAPFSGVIERVLVAEGEVVNPGTPIAILNCDQLAAHLVAKVTRETAQSVSIGTPTTSTIVGQTVALYPYHVSTAATDGGFYTIQYALPEIYNQYVTDTHVVSLQVPVGSPDTGATFTYVPLDAVHQQLESTQLFLFVDGTVQAVEVELGIVQNNFVEVTAGLESGDIVVLNRNVVAGEAATLR